MGLFRKISFYFMYMTYDKEALNEILDKSEKLITQGETAQALELLTNSEYQLVSSSFKPIKARLGKLKNEINRAIITREVYDTDLNRINETSLNVINSLRQEVVVQDKKSEIIFFFLSILLIVIIVLALIPKFYSNYQAGEIPKKTEERPSTVFYHPNLKDTSIFLRITFLNEFEVIAKERFDTNGYVAFFLPDEVIGQEIWVFYDFDEGQSGDTIILYELKDTINLKLNPKRSYN